MNPRDPTRGPAASNRDFGARDYEPAPSARYFEGPPPAPPRDGDPDPQQAEGRALHDATHRALAPSRGPRTGARPDYLTLEEIHERLTDDELIDPGAMEATCSQGQVLLTGSVPQRWMKYRAEDIADAVRGVSDVENRLRVGPFDADAPEVDAQRIGDAPLGGSAALHR